MTIKFLPKPDAHSAFTYTDAKGKYNSVDSAPCYADMFRCPYPHQEFCVKDVTIYFGEGRIKESHGGPQYAAWWVTKGPFKHCFYNTTAKAIRAGEGVRVRNSTKRGEFQVALMGLRNPFEFPNFAWSALVKDGFTKEQAFALSQYYMYKKGAGYYPTSNKLGHSLLSLKLVKFDTLINPPKITEGRMSMKITEKSEYNITNVRGAVFNIKAGAPTIVYSKPEGPKKTTKNSFGEVKERYYSLEQLHETLEKIGGV